MHLGSIELGGIRIDAINGGAVWMDGGGIFGVVPKNLWSMVVTADSENRVPLYFFSLLVRSDDFTAVIEAGSAAHQPAKIREYLRADDSSLLQTLAELGVEPRDVDFFISSHLHYDHVGGASTPDSRAIVFPNAQYVFQKAEWDEARNPSPINRSAYLPGDIAPLESARLLIVDGTVSVAPGLEVSRTGGHSFGHQKVTVGFKPSESLIFAGDLLPTSEHITPRWMCAFDLNAVDTYNAKLRILTLSASEGTVVAPGHGGKAPLLTAATDSKGRFAAQRVPSISPCR